MRHFLAPLGTTTNNIGKWRASRMEGPSQKHPCAGLGCMSSTSHPNREENRKAAQHKGNTTPHWVEIRSNWGHVPTCNPPPFLVLPQLPLTPPQEGFFSQGNKCSIHQGTEAMPLCYFSKLPKGLHTNGNLRRIIFRREHIFTLVSGC